MLFNSFHFAVFFPLVFLFYYALPHRHRWAMLLAASYYFYMCWRAEYALLLLASTLVDYFAALKMDRIERKEDRRPYMLFSLAANLGLLFVFKYANFAASSLQGLFDGLNILVEFPRLKILLPVGISFYTFQTLSYSIDVYRGEIPAERHFGVFALYVSFFPQLVAGPIERASSLLPGLRRAVRFSYEGVRSGAWLMAVGFIKKVVIADRLAPIVDKVYGDPGTAGGYHLLIATYLFAAQIYCDFSGYSDIAVGCARTLGVDLMTNFRRPYAAASIREFWSRWHISLSTWFRDYLYVPLGGNRGSSARTSANIFTVFLLSGLWHGANWTFVAWGALHGLYLLIERAVALTERPAAGWRCRARVFATFHAVCLGWIFFRADSLSAAFAILKKICGFPLLLCRDMATAGLGAGLPLLRDHLGPLPAPGSELRMIAALLLVLAAYERSEERGGGGERLLRSPWWVRWTAYSAALWAVFLLGHFESQQFIYFQF